MNGDLGFVPHNEALIAIDVAYVPAIALGRNCNINQFCVAVFYGNDIQILGGLTERNSMSVLNVFLLTVDP